MKNKNAIRNHIYVYEVDAFSVKGKEITLCPAYYNFEIHISPLVLKRLVQWLVQNQYIFLIGSLSFQIRNRKVNYNDTAKEKGIKTQDSSMCGSSDENSLHTS